MNRVLDTGCALIKDEPMAAELKEIRPLEWWLEFKPWKSGGEPLYGLEDRRKLTFYPLAREKPFPLLVIAPTSRAPNLSVDDLQFSRTKEEIRLPVPPGRLWPYDEIPSPP